MTAASPRREFAQARVPHWRRLGRATAGLAAAAALGNLARNALLGRTFLPGGGEVVGAVLAAAIAVLAHSYVHSWTRRDKWLRGLGYVAAGVVAGVGLGSLASASRLPWTEAVCFLLLGLSLLLKARVLPLAVAGDVVVGFYCFTTALDYLWGNPGGSTMGPGTAVALTGLAAAWMLVWPEMRPAAFFLERGSAGALMRWLLPITLAYPLLLSSLQKLRATDHLFAAQAAQFTILYGTVLLGVGLLWIICRQLDSRDFRELAAAGELRASEQRYRLMFETSPLPMWIFDYETLRYLAVNDAAVRRFGYSRPEFLRMTALDVRPAEDHELLKSDLARHSNATGRLWKYITKSGETLQAEVFAHAIEWEGRAANLSYLRDVTAQIEAETQLRESEAQVRDLLASTSEGIFATDLGAKVIWCNPATAELLGYESAEQILGRNMHQLAHHTRADGSPYPEEECAGKLAAARGVPYNSDDELLWRADGTPLPVEMRSSPLRRDGRDIGTVVTFVDITERKRLTAQIQQAQKMEAVGRLSAGLAHDFNNLLTVVNGYAEMLMAQPSLAPAHAKLAAIRRAGERGAALTRQLLAFSRQQVVEAQVLDLNAAVRETEPLLRRLVGEAVQMRFELAEELGPIRGDAGQLGQVLMNLVGNARDAVGEGGTILVRTARAVASGARILLAVEDNGCGMDQATQSRLFEPFFTTKPQGQGTGLGLATVYGIVQQCGGTIAVHSEPGRGTTMTVYLPTVAAAAPSARPEPAPAAAETPCRERVLVVEDEDIVRELACEVLETAGYRVRSAGLPSQGLKTFEATPDEFDLLLTDVVMPEFNGRKLAERILAQRPGLPVLYMSGYTDNAIGTGGELEAGLAFLAKPFTPAELNRKVREVLDRHRAATAGN